MSSKPKILFVYDHQYPDLWQDGLWAALKELEADFAISYANLHLADSKSPFDHHPERAAINPNYDFYLGWGAFGSSVDTFLRSNYGPVLREKNPKAKVGLCIAGNAFPPTGANNYDILFYETKWYRPQIDWHQNIVQAFGINGDIYQPDTSIPKLWDYLGVGALADWKRWERMKAKPGTRLVVGEYQRGNEPESLRIAQQLLRSGAGVLPMVPATTLAHIYNQARTVYIPADINGGGERAVLEARACGISVEVEDDNPKLQELVALEKIPTHIDYAKQLKKGILSVL